MDITALNNISYGLYLLCATDKNKDNACIINTLQQVTVNPARISITVQKNNHTHDMIVKTGVFNICSLTEETPFSLFENFGFKSGRDTNKFTGAYLDMPYAENGVVYLNRFVNSVFSGKVISATDLGTHTLFIADLTDAVNITNKPSITYAYYHKNTKPKPQSTATKGFRCKICNYEYEGDTLPADYVCPICGHGAADFEAIN